MSDRYLAIKEKLAQVPEEHLDEISEYIDFIQYRDGLIKNEVAARNHASVVNEQTMETAMKLAALKKDQEK